MDDDQLHRKLAAVFTADMVGYSTRMEADEAGTLALHKRIQVEVIYPLIERFHGRMVKLMGDGLLAEFASVVDAVNCAISIQRELSERQKDEQKKKAILYRIGINLGDVIEEDGDLFGDGVNIAARLEQLAEPGGICISGTAYDHLKSNVEASYEALGEIQVKNISRPVRAYKVLAGAKNASQIAISSVASKNSHLRLAGIFLIPILAIGSVFVWWWSSTPPVFEPVDPASMALELPDEPSIAVLPFANLSDDKDQEYFADGMADDMITDLSKLPGLFVIARNSSFAYKGKSLDVREVARQLGVRYVLEGSVRRLGDQIRINAQLIDAVTGGHLWAERYDDSFEDLIKVQDRIRSNVIAALSDELGYVKEPFRRDRGTDNSEAYDAYLIGWERLRAFTPQSIAASIPPLQRALEIDPEYARARAALAEAYFSLWRNRWGEAIGLSSLQLSRKFKLQLDLALEKPTPLAYQVAAKLEINRSNFEEAIGKAEKALALNENDSAGLIALATAYLYAKNPDAALVPMKKALRLDPKHGPDDLVLLGEIEFSLGNYREASRAFQRALVGNPTYPKAILYLASTYGHLGEQQKLEEAITRFNELQISKGEPGYRPDITDDPKYELRIDPEKLKAGLSNAEPWRKLISGTPGDYQVKGAKRVEISDAKQLFDDNALFYDLQGENPYSVITIPGAIRGNVLKMTRKSLSAIASKDQRIVFFERHYRYIGQAEAAAKAVYWGYKSVFHIHGGVWEWRDAGYPIEKR